MIRALIWTHCIRKLLAERIQYLEQFGLDLKTWRNDQPVQNILYSLTSVCYAPNARNG